MQPNPLLASWIFPIMEKIYCIYTDRLLTKEETNREHIIPLSLGGSNGFEISVDKEFNSKVGSKIDGAMANDFLTLFSRREFGSKGHSGKEPYPLAKKSKLIERNKPVQVAFKKEGIQIYSPIDKRYLTEEEKQGQRFQLSFSVNPDNNLRFTAKVALAAGYFIYGDLFRNDVETNELRRFMLFNRGDKKEDFKDIKTRGWFWPHKVEEKDNQDFAIYEYFAKYLNCSFILSIPGPRNVGIVVSLFGKLIGILNIPGRTKNFPTLNKHDLGHVVILRDGTMDRISYRSLAKQAYEAMT